MGLKKGRQREENNVEHKTKGISRKNKCETIVLLGELRTTRNNGLAEECSDSSGDQTPLLVFLTEISPQEV